MALVELIQQGQYEAAFSLLERNPELADERDQTGLPATLLALYHGQSDLASAILDRKEKLSIFECAAFGKGSELKSALNDADVNDFAADGFQAIHLAAHFGRSEELRSLIKAKADLNTLSNNDLGVAPLHAALANGHESVARELVFEGADVNMPAASLWTPLHYAAYLGSKPLILFFLEQGAKPVPGPDGKTPADLAAEKGHEGLMQLLGSA
ncbi:MAG TPA: ankyrin repeat domain-containing protein [Fimbriimonas sp.]|nr:ankyrin repeat domain-containing protein [Fimbriimonas sp.]